MSGFVLTRVATCKQPDATPGAASNIAITPSGARRVTTASFSHMIEFGARLPQLRRRLKQDLALPGLPKYKVLAVIVTLLDGTLIRIGNREYARTNDSYGLTTLRDKHVSFARLAHVRG